jgi:hypothetical protein
MVHLFLAAAAATFGASAAFSPPPTIGPTIMPSPDFRAAKGSRISIGFAPPVGSSIRYMREETEGGAVYRQEIVVTFERVEGGYRMHAAPQGATGHLPPRLQLGLQPVTVRLTGDGTFLSVEDVDGYWRRSDMLLAKWRADRRYAAEASRLTALSQSVRALAPGGIAYAVAGAYAPVTLMSRLEVRVGDQLEVSESAGYNDAVPEEQLTRSLAFHPAWASASRLRMEVTASFDPGSSLRIAQRLGGDAAGARLKATGGSIVERTVQEVALATGLALLHESRFVLRDGGTETTLSTVRLTCLSPTVP